MTKTVWPNGLKTRPSITSNYGKRAPIQTPGGTTSSFHTGTDFGAGNFGDGIKSVQPGTVIFAGYYGGNGNEVRVQHANGCISRYCHMSRIDVSVGQVVDAGTRVGLVGQTGMATGPHLHFRIDQPLTVHHDPLPLMESWLAGDVALTGTQRRAIAIGARRRATPDRTQPAIEPGLPGGSIGNFNGWIHGERVNESGYDSDIWFRGTSGNWFWSGAFEDKGTHDLSDLNPPPVVVPPPATEQKRKVLSKAANVRDYTSTVTGKVVATLEPDVELVVREYAIGQSVTQNGFTSDVWFVVGDKRYASAVVFTSQSIEGLTKVTVPPPADNPYPAGPNPPVWEKFYPGATRVVPAAYSNFENEYSVPDPANRKGFPAKPEGIVQHQWGAPGDYPLSSVVNTISGPKTPGNEAGAHWVIGINAEGQVEVIEMGQPTWRMYGSGPGGNDKFQIENDPRMTPEVIEANRALQVWLRDTFGDGEPLANELHKNQPGAATSCGVYIEPHLTALAIPAKEDPTDPDPEPEPDTALRVMLTTIRDAIDTYLS